MRRPVVVGPLFLLCSAFLLQACGPAEGELPPQPLASSTQALVLPDRSLAVTEERILEPFTLQRVMDQIVATSGVSGVTPVSLFQQWWDTQNLAPGIGAGPHCDDETLMGVPALNGYPWECPRAEGYQAHVDPFRGLPRDHLYMPIGLFNRFDLAPANGAHCGEYRIVFAMRPGHRDARGRNFLIFEAVLPNPDPARGIGGCLPVAQFWYDLTSEPDPMVRQRLLFDFYFRGLPGFEPVVHARHYGTQLTDGGYGCTTGQIRTNQFVGGEWNLREFRLVNDCRCGSCFLVMAPTTVKDNPYGKLFDSSTSHPAAPALQSTVVGAVGSLGTGGVNDLGWSVSNKLNTGESVSLLGGPYDYLTIFNDGTAIDPTFFDAIDAEIASVWPGLYHPEQIVTRAQTQSCAGCHHTTNSADIGNGFVWPDSLRFVHVEEFVSGGFFPMSDALRHEFLPHRADLLESFVLSGGTSPPTDTKCEIPVPRELEVDCQTRAARDVTLRPFTPSGLESLTMKSLQRAESLGGARVH